MADAGVHPHGAGVGEGVIVADTNLIAYLLIAGALSAAAQRVWDRDGKWLAPTVWRHELLNMLDTSVRTKHMSLVQAQEVWIHAPAFVHDAEAPPLDVLSLAAD